MKLYTREEYDCLYKERLSLLRWAIFFLVLFIPLSFFMIETSGEFSEFFSWFYPIVGSLLTVLVVVMFYDFLQFKKKKDIGIINRIGY